MDMAYTSLVGVRAAGKSTCAGLMLICALDMAERQGSKIRVLVDEKTLPIRTIADNLLNGYFPEPTGEDDRFEAALSIQFGGFLRSSKMQMSITDVAGETLSELLDAFQSGRFQIPDVPMLQQVNQYVLNATSFILLVDLQRLLMPDSLEGRVPQDAQLARFIDLLVKFKAANKKSPPIKGVALLMTKYDLVEHLLTVRDHLSLQDEEGKSHFLRKYLLQTTRALRDAVGEKYVEVFHSSVMPEDAEEEGMDGEQAVRLDPVSGRPVYSAAEYERLLLWMGQILR